MIRVGPAGWSYADWEGIVVPRRKPRDFHALRHLARFFDCVEINSSFYAIPERRHAERWVELVADREDFRFLAKLQRELTHAPWDRGAARKCASAFRAALAPLRTSGRLGAWLAQFPVSFRNSPANRGRLAELAELFEDDPRAIELRHRSWFEPAALRHVSDLGWSVAHIDLPSAPEHPPKWHSPTGPVGYLRLHGRNATAWFDASAARNQRYDYLYSGAEVRAAGSLARRLADECADTYVVTNNHFSGQAVANAIEITADLVGTRVPAPAELVDAFPRLATVARREGQGRLF